MVMMTVASAGGGHLGAQQGSERAKKEEEGSTKQSARSGVTPPPGRVFKQMALLTYMNPLHDLSSIIMASVEALEVLY